MIYIHIFFNYIILIYINNNIKNNIFSQSLIAFNLNNKNIHYIK